MSITNQIYERILERRNQELIQLEEKIQDYEDTLAAITDKIGYTEETAKQAEIATGSKLVSDGIKWWFDQHHYGVDMIEVFRNLLRYAERKTCLHDETYRGGSIWEICRYCGEKWADDEGGKPENAHNYPEEIVMAQNFLLDFEKKNVKK